MASSKKALGILFGVKGGSSISQGSGALILQDLKKIVNQVNNNNKLLPKVELRFDVSDAIKSINKLQKALNSLQKQTKNINIPNGGKGGGKSSAYTQNLAEVKKYFKELKALQKAAARTKDVDVDKSGNILGIHGDNYLNHYKYYQELESKYKDLNKKLRKTGKSAAQEAKGLGLTIDEYNELTKVVDELQKQAGIAFDKIKIDATAAWQKQASNVSDSIHRVYDTISKDPAVKDLADDILEMTKQGSGNVEELKQKFQEFNLKARQSGADIETWGQKFKKAFANQVRSALASLITVDIGQILKGVYDNVVALDDAVVNLQIASGKSRTETKALVKEYAALAKQLKATTAEVSASADTWLRQGYSAKEAQTLITNSMMLSKLGQIESEEAATALTSTMKGYKVAVEDTVNIVDKLTAVDMEAAASAGGIATAMAETAAGAGLAGVSMDKLIGYLAVVKEVTQDADESVGVFFRTLFSRMGNIKAGKFVDDDGESLNDVESVLGKLGIKLRNSNDDFRDFSDVLDEVGQKWDRFSETEKNAIASAMAGTRQREKLIVLMDNYGTSLKYAATAAESAGTATQKYEAYTEGVTGSIQELKAAFEEFSLTALDSDFVTQFLDLGTEVVDMGSKIMSFIDMLGGLNTVLAAILGTVVMFKAHKIASAVSNISGSVTTLVTFMAAHSKRGTLSFDSFAKELNRVGVEASASSVKLSLFSAAVTAVIAAVNAYNSFIERKVAENIKSANELVENARARESSFKELVAEYEEIYKSSNGIFDASQAQRVCDIQEDIKDLVGEHAYNLELVNGQLDAELEKLDKIRSKTREISKAEAEEALTDAENAIRAKTNTFGKTFDFRGKDLSAALEKYGGDVATTWDYTGVLFGGVDELITGNFELEDLLLPATYGQLRLKEPQNAAEFVAQYEAIKKLKTDIGSGDDDKLKKSDLYGELGDYISHYQDVYDTYVSAKKAVDEFSKETSDEDELIKLPSNGTTDDQIVETLKHTEEELNALLDRYKELIELRKELLKTYAKELEYQKELEKKQQKAASLQTKLAIARLDNSAAGQARVRELEAQLEEAQNDLEDFTLEHAIEEIIKGIDNQYIEYEAFISAEIDKITKKIDELKDGKPPEEDLKTDEALKAEHAVEVALKSSEFKDALADTLKKEFFGDSGNSGEVIPDEQTMFENIQSEMNRLILEDILASGGTNIGNIRKHYLDAWQDISELMKVFPEMAYRDYKNLISGGYKQYHAGGFVGGVPTLANNEEFAKLLEGEFVSTPSQIKNFMTRTLPQLTSFNSSGGYEFHAPLVEIKCESVTSESMPKLKEIVDEAVGEIKRCLDSGMSRTGYKRSVKKLLT